MLAVDRYIEACQIESRSMSVAGLKRVSIFCIMAALALTSKEPAVVLFAAAPLYLLLARRDAPMIRRTQELAVLMVPALCVGLIYFLVRARVLGESFGGYHLDNTIWDMALLVANFLPGDLLAPGFPSAVESVLPFYAKLSLFFSSTLGYAFAGITLIAFGSWGLWLWASRTSTRTNLESDRDADRTAVMRTLVFGLSVMGVFAIVFALTAAYDRRLLYPMLPFYSLLPALLFDAAYHEAGLTVRGRASSVSIVRRSALIGIGAIALVALLVQSPLLSRDQEWREAGRATDLLTTGLQEQWDELPPRSLVWVVNLPAGFDFDSSRRIQYTERSSTNALNAAALQSWLDDRWPRRRLRVNSLGSYRYHEPLRGFRHNARLHEGWLEFDEPRARADVDYVFARERGFELRELGEGRLALARSKAPRPRHEYLLVADGIAPIFVSTSKLEVIH
jgi:hypothetical protein